MQFHADWVQFNEDMTENFNFLKKKTKPVETAAAAEDINRNI